MQHEGAEQHGWFDLSTLKEPYRLEGKKTMGYELAEQMDWKHAVQALEAEATSDPVEAAQRVQADDGMSTGLIYRERRPAWRPPQVAEPSRLAQIEEAVLATVKPQTDRVSLVAEWIDLLKVRPLFTSGLAFAGSAALVLLSPTLGLLAALLG